MKGWVILSASICFSAFAAADGKPAKYPVDTESFELTLTSDGQPVRAAKVRLYACRCEEDRGSHYGWPSANIDQPTEFTSDEDGKVTFKYPVKFGSPENWKTISQISMLITHAEYVPDELHIDPREKRAEKELKSGCELTFSAIDAARQALEFGIVMAGPGRGANWLPEADGAVRSCAIPDGTWQTMLVSPKADGRHLFSGVLAVRLADQQDVKIRNLKLKPGLRIVGRLSDDVPRPVESGRVQAYCIPKPANDSWSKEDPSLTWSANAPIRDDGTFEFLSLPRTGKIQFIAICRGWVGADEGEPKPKVTFKQGMIVDIDQLDLDEYQYQDLVLPMEQTGSIRVTVLKPDGSPLAGASVATNPNQYWLLGGSNVLGADRRSIENIKSQIDPDNPSSEIQRDHTLPRYSAKTDENGTATLADIPLKRNYQVGAYHDDYILPPGDNGRRKRESFRCESTKAVAVTIKMQAVKKESD